MTDARAPQQPKPKQPDTTAKSARADKTKRNGKKTDSNVPSPSTQLPLVPTLLFFALAELVTHRLIMTALQPALLEDITAAYRFFATYSPFLYHAASLLAVAALSWVLLDMTRDHLTAPLSWRVVLGLSFCTFIPIAAVGSFVASSQEVSPYQSVRLLLPYLNGTFILVLLIVVIISWARPLHYRMRAAMLLLAVPLVLLALYQHRVFGVTVPKTQPNAFKSIRRASFLAEYGALGAHLVGYWAFLLLTPPLGGWRRKKKHSPGQSTEQSCGPTDKTQPNAAMDIATANTSTAVANAANTTNATPAKASSQAPLTTSRLSSAIKERLDAWLALLTGPIPLLGALLLVVALGALVKTHYTTSQRLAQAALGIDVPAPALSALPYLISYFLFFAVIIALLLHGPRSRILAAGLALMTLAGYRLEEPLGYVLNMLGLLAFYRGAVACKEAEAPTPTPSPGPTISERRWRAYLQVLGEALAHKDRSQNAALETAIVDTGKTQVSRLFGRWNNTPLDLRFGRRHRGLTSVEITLGEVPTGASDWTINRRSPQAAAIMTPSTRAGTRAGTRPDTKKGPTTSSTTNPTATEDAQTRHTSGDSQTNQKSQNTENSRNDSLSGAQAAFQANFAVTDRENLTDRLLEPPDHLEAVGRIYGKVSVWWGIGLKHWIDPRLLSDPIAFRRYAQGKRVFLPLPLENLVTDSNKPPPPGRMPELLELLYKWAQRSGVAPKPAAANTAADEDEDADAVSPTPNQVDKEKQTLKNEQKVEAGPEPKSNPNANLNPDLQSDSDRPKKK
jgi:hypothetical protein